MLRLAFDFIITWRETRTRPNAYNETIILTGSHSKLFLIVTSFPTGIKAPEKMNFHKHIPNNQKLKLP